MGSLAVISLCVLLALTLYDGVDGDESSHNIQARHFGWGGGRGGGGGYGGSGGHGHGGGPPLPPLQPQGGGYFKMLVDFLNMFPMFSNVQTQNRQQAVNYIINIFKQQPNLMNDISVYLRGMDVNTRNQIIFIFQDMLKGSGVSQLNPLTIINLLAQLFPNELELQLKLLVFFGGLDQATQNKIFYNLGSVDAKTQIQILRELGEKSQTPGIIVITINGEPITINNGVFLE